MNLETWTNLRAPSSQALVLAAQAADPHSPAALANLRKLCPDAALVSAALQLAEARAKAHAKFASRASTLWADPQGVEMASSALSGTHKAARFARMFSGQLVVDLCSGIGGDAMALASAGCEVLAVDLDPVRAWMSGLNAACASRCSDAAAPDLPDAPFHLDPARRSADGMRRLFRYADLIPGPQVIESIITRRRTGAIKLGPGVNTSDLPAITSPSEIEFISESGQLTQAVFWLGELASSTHARTATLLRSSSSSAIQIHGCPDSPGQIPISPIQGIIHTIDASVERAELLAELCRQTRAAMPHASLGLLTSSTPIAHPMLTPFQVLADMPWNQRRCRQELSRLNAGLVEVKTRAKAVDTDTLQRELRGKGEAPLVVFVLRFDRALRCIITRRILPES